MLLRHVERGSRLELWLLVRVAFSAGEGRRCILRNVCSRRLLLGRSVLLIRCLGLAKSAWHPPSVLRPRSAEVSALLCVCMLSGCSKDVVS
eukprot:1114691-Rhodomonas_salina.2